MSKYVVGCKVSIYYDIEVEAGENWNAEEMAIEKFAELLEQVNLPNPLEFDSIEVWDIEKNEEKASV